MSYANLGYGVRITKEPFKGIPFLNIENLMKDVKLSMFVGKTNTIFFKGSHYTCCCFRIGWFSSWSNALSKIERRLCNGEKVW